MNVQRRAIVYAAILAAILIGAAVRQVSWMLDQRADARAAARDLAECRALAQDIQILAALPTAGSGQTLAGGQLHQRVEAAALQAGLDPAALEGFYPQSPRRVGESLYLEKPTTLPWRGVALGPVAACLYHLTVDSGLSVTDLRLRAPRGQSDGHLWDVEATVTYVVPAPATTTEPRR